MMDIMVIVGHMAYALNAMAFLLRDMLWLRVLAVTASGCNIFYNLYGAEATQWIAVFWHSVFIAINSGHIFVMVRAIMGVRYTPEQKVIYRECFRAFTPVDFCKFAKRGRLEDFKKGDVLAVEGEALGNLYLIYEGDVRVSKGEDVVVDLHDYAFVGEIAFTTDGVASATVEVLGPARVFVWDFEDLEEMLSKNTAMRVAFQTCVGVDMAKKLGLQH